MRADPSLRALSHIQTAGLARTLGSGLSLGPAGIRVYSLACGQREWSRSGGLPAGCLLSRSTHVRTHSHARARQGVCRFFAWVPSPNLPLHFPLLNAHSPCPPPPPASSQPCASPTPLPSPPHTHSPLWILTHTPTRTHPPTGRGSFLQLSLSLTHTHAHYHTPHT